jgi:hypothetical protein
MSTVGLILAASLSSFSSPPDADSSDPNADAPVIIVTPAATTSPPPAPAIPDWGPQADVEVSHPAGEPPGNRVPMAPPAFHYKPRAPMMGIGLMIGSAVVFGVGLSSRVGQVDTAVSNCRSWSTGGGGGGSGSVTWSGDGFASRTQCFNHFDSPGTDGGDLFVGAAYGSSMVLTMIGAGALGQHQAWQSVHGDLKVRRPLSRYVFGAIFTGLGIASIGAHYALIYANSQNPCTSWECNVQRRALWIAASDGGAFMINTGLGLFSWAGHYRRNLERYQRMQWSVLPGATPGSLGATAALRF